MMDCLCLIGTVLGALAAFWPSYGNKIAFIALWVMYQSLYQVGQTFLWFQWDILLLEVSLFTYLFIRAFFKKLNILL